MSEKISFTLCSRNVCCFLLPVPVIHLVTPSDLPFDHLQGPPKAQCWGPPLQVIHQQNIVLLFISC